MADENKKYSLAERAGESLRQTAGQKPSAAIPPLDIKKNYPEFVADRLTKAGQGLTFPVRAVGKVFEGSTDAARSYNAAKLSPASATGTGTGVSTVVADSSVKNLPAPVVAKNTGLIPSTSVSRTGTAEASIPPLQTPKPVINPSPGMESGIGVNPGGNGNIMEKLMSLSGAITSAKKGADIGSIYGNGFDYNKVYSDVSGNFWGQPNANSGAPVFPGRMSNAPGASLEVPAGKEPARGVDINKGSFTNADLEAYKGSSGAATSPENLAIIEKNAADASSAWDDTLRNIRESNMQDTIQRAASMPSPERLAAANIADKAMGTSKTTGIDLKGLEAGRGLNLAQTANQTAQAEKARKEALSMPESVSERQQNELEKLRAAHPTEKLNIGDIAKAANIDVYNSYGEKTGTQFDKDTFNFLMKRYGLSTGPDDESEVPQGYTVIGRDKKTGKTIYRDPSGNTVTEE